MSTRRKPQSRNPALQGARSGGRPSVPRPAGGAAAGGSTRMGDGRVSDGRTGERRTGDPRADGGADAAAPVSGAARAAAVGLWGVVGVGLVYGISQTAVKVAALFS